MDQPSTTIPPLTEAQPATRFDGFRDDLAMRLTDVPETFREIFARQPYWKPVAIAFALLTILVYATSWTAWFNGDMTFALQPFVLFAVIYAIWRDRFHAQMGYAELTDAFVEDSARRRGILAVSALGCAFIFAGVLAIIPAVTVFGYVLVIWGAVYYLYGTKMLRVLGQPLFYLLFMPPWLTFLGFFTRFFQLATTIVTSQLLQLLAPGTQTHGVFVALPNFTLEINEACSGANVIYPVLILTAFLALFRRLPLSWTGIIMVISGLISMIVNVLRLVAIGLIGGSDANVANWLHDANASSLVFAALAFYLTYLVLNKLIQPARRKQTEFERDLAWSAQMQSAHDDLTLHEDDDFDDDDDEEDDE